MKKLVMLLFAIVIVLGLSAQTKNYEIKINVDDFQSEKSLMLQYNGEETVFHEMIVNGDSLSYKGEVEYPLVVTVFTGDPRADKGPYPTTVENIWAVICPGEVVTAKGTISDYCEVYFECDAENRALSKINKQVFPLLNESANLFIKIRQDDSISEEERNELGRRSFELKQEASEIQRRMLDEDPSSVGALWYLNEMLGSRQITPEEVERIIEKVDSRYYNHPYYKVLKSKIVGANESMIGNVVPEIVSNRTPDGKIFDINSLRGKYVIIDFWGTWCGPCMEGMPRMKEYLDNYKDKLQILGISNDRDMEHWKTTIEESELTWSHIFNGRGEQNFVVKFNVAGFPTKIIVGPDGKILYRSVGEKEEFYTKLEQLLNR